MPDDMSRRVAEACGFKLEYSMSWRYWIPNGDGTRSARLFSPSTKECDAVLAAEKFGLFRLDKHACGIQQLADGRWDVWQDCSMTGIVSSANTFCEAICQAICRLADTKGG